MKKSLAAILMISCFAFSQESKVQIGFQLYPNISTGFPNDNAPNSGYYGSSECYVFSQSVGVQTDFNFKKKWTVSTGLLFNKSGDRSKKIPPDIHRGFFWSFRFYKMSLFSLELPLLLQRNFGNNLNLQLGASPNIIFGSRYILKTDGGKTKIPTEYYDTNIFGLTLNAGFGYRIHFDERYVHILPYFQYNILDGILELQFIETLPSRQNVSAGIKLSLMLW